MRLPVFPYLLLRSTIIVLFFLMVTVRAQEKSTVNRNAQLQEISGTITPLQSVSTDGEMLMTNSPYIGTTYKVPEERLERLVRQLAFLEGWRSGRSPQNDVASGGFSIAATGYEQKAGDSSDSPVPNANAAASCNPVPIAKQEDIAEKPSTLLELERIPGEPIPLANAVLLNIPANPTTSTIKTPHVPSHPAPTVKVEDVEGNPSTPLRRLARVVEDSAVAPIPNANPVPSDLRPYEALKPSSVIHNKDVLGERSSGQKTFVDDPAIVPIPIAPSPVLESYVAPGVRPITANDPVPNPQREGSNPQMRVARVAPETAVTPASPTFFSFFSPYVPAPLVAQILATLPPPTYQPFPANPYPIAGSSVVAAPLAAVLAPGDPLASGPLGVPRAGSGYGVNARNELAALSAPQLPALPPVNPLRDDSSLYLGNAVPALLPVAGLEAPGPGAPGFEAPAADSLRLQGGLADGQRAAKGAEKGSTAAATTAFPTTPQVNAAPAEAKGAVLESIMRELHDIEVERSAALGSREGLPCSVEGSWTARAAGIRLDISFAGGERMSKEKRSSIGGAWEEEGALKVAAAEAVPRVVDALLGPHWRLRGHAPFRRSGLFTLVGVDPDRRQTLTFTGQCRVCGGADTITGLWVISHEPRDCRDTHMFLNEYRDVFRRETLHLLREKRLRELERTKSSTSASFPCNFPSIKVTADHHTTTCSTEHRIS